MKSELTTEDYLAEKLAGLLKLLYHICGNRFSNEWVSEDLVNQYSLSWDQRRWETYEDWKARKEQE